MADRLGPRRIRATRNGGDRLTAKLETTSTALASKPNYRTWWHRLAAYLATLALTLAGRDFGRFWTTLGDTIYAPEGHEIDLTDPNDYAVVCHELAHRYDDREHGWSYRLSYVVSSRARARWEVRGYGMQIVAAYRELGRIPTQWPRQFADHICGPAYLWAGDRTEVRESLEAIASAIERGALDAENFRPDVLDPYITF